MCTLFSFVVINPSTNQSILSMYSTYQSIYPSVIHSVNQSTYQSIFTPSENHPMTRPIDQLTIHLIQYLLNYTFILSCPTHLLSLSLSLFIRLYYCFDVAVAIVTPRGREDTGSMSRSQPASEPRGVCVCLCVRQHSS